MKTCRIRPLKQSSLDHLDIPIWVEGANVKSSTRKLNKLRNATKLTMSMLARERARTSSATKKVTADIET